MHAETGKLATVVRVNVSGTIRLRYEDDTEESVPVTRVDEVYFEEIHDAFDPIVVVRMDSRPARKLPHDP